MVISDDGCWRNRWGVVGEGVIPKIYGLEGMVLNRVGYV